MPGSVRHRAACSVRSARRHPPARAARPNRTPPRIRITTPSTPGTRPGTVYGLTWSSSKRGIAALATTIAMPSAISTSPVTKSALTMPLSYGAASALVTGQSRYARPARVRDRRRRSGGAVEERVVQDGAEREEHEPDHEAPHRADQRAAERRAEPDVEAAHDLGERGAEAEQRREDAVEEEHQGIDDAKGDAERRRSESHGRSYPLIEISGFRRATRRARPARSATTTTAPTSL